MSATGEPIVVLGAGLAGLVCAGALRDAGRSVVVVDKGRRPGGRMATRRMAGLGGATARVDHGAQFFTVRSEEFAQVVSSWQSAALVHEWCRGFRVPEDGFARWSAPQGMRSIAEHLAADLDVRCETTVHAVSGFDGSLCARSDDGQEWRTTTMVITSPVPQSLAILENGWLPIPEEAEDALRRVSYAPCFALLVTLDGPGAVPPPGALQAEDGEHPVFSFVGDNRAKGASPVPAITFHASPSWSAARFDDDLEDVRADMLAAAADLLGGAQPIEVALHRWRYARPVVLHPERSLTVEPIPGTRLVFAGDAFGEAKVEGAVRSGLAAAAAVMAP